MQHQLVHCEDARLSLANTSLDKSAGAAMITGTDPTLNNVMLFASYYDAGRLGPRSHRG